VLLAYASNKTGSFLPCDLIRLVEKTPTNELHLARLRRSVPEARFVHIVRDPLAVFASRKQMEMDALGSFTSEARALREMRRSFEIAEREQVRSDYLLVRYEDLVTSPEREMSRIAEFVGIEMSHALLVPSVARMPTAANSSFRSRSPFGTVVPVSLPLTNRLSGQDRSKIASALGGVASRFGYSLDT
jgi:hypothetical protein